MIHLKHSEALENGNVSDIRRGWWIFCFYKWLFEEDGENYASKNDFSKRMVNIQLPTIILRRWWWIFFFQKWFFKDEGEDFTIIVVSFSRAHCVLWKKIICYIFILLKTISQWLSHSSVLKYGTYNHELL